MQTVAGSQTSYSGPSIMQDGAGVVIAEQGADNSLDFFWAASVGSRWHPETVAGPRTTFSSPALTVNGASVNIAAEGPGGSLDFYWAANGTPTWTREIVAGPGAIASAPAITANDGSVNVAAILAAGGLGFYWAVNGTAAWHLETLPGLFGIAPGITTDTGGVHVVSAGFGILEDEATSNGTGTWHATYVAGGLFDEVVGPGSPAVTMNDGIENIATIGTDGNLYFWWYRGDGSFAMEVVDTSANL